MMTQLSSKTMTTIWKIIVNMNMMYTQYIFGSRKQKNIFWFLIQVLPFVAASKSGNVSFVQEPVSEEIFSKYNYK